MLFGAPEQAVCTHSVTWLGSLMDPLQRHQGTGLVPFGAPDQAHSVSWSGSSMTAFSVTRNSAACAPYTMR